MSWARRRAQRRWRRRARMPVRQSPINLTGVFLRALFVFGALRALFRGRGRRV